MTRGHHDDPWQSLRQRTPARVAIGRAGGSLPTAEVLKFALDHAEARDAVHADLDDEMIERELAGVHSKAWAYTQATTAAEYLLRPELGRSLMRTDSVEMLRMFGNLPIDVAIILADGLSATAANRHGVALVKELLPRLKPLHVGPIILVRHARVAVEDEIGHAMKARCAVIILGERPGLGTADSLGAYLVFDPKPGKTDADRNCVSNIRPAGLPLSAAAETIAYLIHASLTRQISGVHLKDDRPRILP